MDIKPTYSITDQLCLENHPENCALTIFGASGDLTRRKLIPALAQLHLRGLLPPRFFVVGFARTPLTSESYREEVRRNVREASPAFPPDKLDSFCARCYYVPGNYRELAFFKNLGIELAKLEQQYGTGGNRVFYLATPPEVYTTVAESLAAAGLTQEGNHRETPWQRVVLEKPFGRDLETALELDRRLHGCLTEKQLYRIDHYLGKDTVQNILMLRFANTVFEPVWNRHYVDHVQITAAESLGIGQRAGYYDQAGCLRDMFQNHMLQLLALVAMEPPANFSAGLVLDEKVKLLGALQPFEGIDTMNRVVRAQYAPGAAAGAPLTGYLAEPGVTSGSSTETYVATKLFVDNWRWQGVPFYLRSGKRLAKRVTEIAVVFKPVPHSIFAPLTASDLARNVLVMNVQPDEGMELTIQAKRPGPHLCMSALTMNVQYREAFKEDPPEAYERLLLDVMLGDQTLFLRSDFIAAAWRLLMPVFEAWGTPPSAPPLHTYPAGSWGPEAADKLLADDGREWRRI